jgi:hypothetical protein
LAAAGRAGTAKDLLLHLLALVRNILTPSGQVRVVDADQVLDAVVI